MPTAKLTKNQLLAAICFALAIGTFLLYLPVRHNGFTNFDDDAYITGNPHVKAGVTWSGIVWAFQSGYAANWHPLTWISHMVDCQLFGLNPAGHHLMNVLFHIANTILLFILLNKMTGAIWRGAFVAALFAWHPMHVESVAWAAERKDVLSAFFWVLTLIAYTGYAQERQLRHNSQSILYYVLALVMFACGLMSKPMVVTLPFVLLLLDFWPLQRVNASTLLRLTAEKIPFLALSFMDCVVTYLVQKKGGAVVNDSLLFRASNALWAYEQYIAKIFWPTDLAIVYPFLNHGLALLAAVSCLLLAVCSVAFILLRNRWPYLFVGWFWFLGTLVPVIGIVRVGSASMADRYAYLPSIGLFILVTWGLADFCKSLAAKKILGTAALVALAICFVLTSIQIAYWRSSITLFRHALMVTTDNYVANACLGQALDVAGDEADALIYCKEAVRINPEYPAGQFFLGMVLWKKGELPEALKCLEYAAQETPGDSGFQYNLGKFLTEHGSPDKAVERFNAALKDNPDFPEAHNALGKTFLSQGKLPEAAEQLSLAASLDLDNAQYHYDFGTVLFAEGKAGAAVDQLSEAVRLQPDFADAQGNLAAALASQGQLTEAITHFSKAAELQPNNPEAHFNLGFAYLNNRQPAEAEAQFLKELHLAPNEARVHYRLAEALQEQNKLPDAVTHYREALRLTPNLPGAKKELDEILAAHPELR
jgi:tetratricopeptide (TPR) repeat protein